MTPPDDPGPGPPAAFSSPGDPPSGPPPVGEEERPAVRLLVGREALQQRVAELGAELRADYRG
ncbi:MAG TPA: hypothetical protein VHS79_21560, partial [Actinomycetes bacterium]|nr:hypothetical protein [Actinomycetes bacterium]